MNYREFSTSYKWVKLADVPVASFIIIALWSQFFWKTEDFWYSITIISVVNILFFVIPYYFVFPKLINSESVALFVSIQLFFVSLFTLTDIFLFKSGILTLPSPFFENDYRFTFFISLFIIFNLTIYHSSLSIYMTLNSYAITFDSYRLLQKSYDSEINALRLQMNPHFLSNALNNLNSLIHLKEKDKAINYTSTIIELLSEQLKYSNASYISIQDELKWLNQYLQMELARSTNQFEYNVEVKNNDLYSNLIPPMLIQPLVENSIIHGFNSHFIQNNKGIINIIVKRTNAHTISILVEDNGTGLNTKQPIQKSRKSIATTNIEKRIQLINAIGKFHLKLIRTQNINGTKCELVINELHP
jgi:sensor histidine kinase YesM